MDRHADLLAIQNAVTMVVRVQSNRRARRRLEDRAGVPLAPVTVETLGVIRALGPVRHGAVARRVGTQASRISKEVRTLVEAGMVVESADPDDRRAVLLTVTDKGTDALTRYVAAARETLGEVLADWTDRELASFARMITRLADQFAGFAEAADRSDETEALT